MDFVNPNHNSSDWSNAFLGGVIIGIATTINFGVMGRITGNSGIFNTLFKLDFKSGWRWKASFFVGLTYIGFVLYHICDNGVLALKSKKIVMFDPKETAGEGLSLIGWIISGLLVGIGTKAGNGCTSGHGVCGLPRFSKRSLVAVLTFMAVCAFTATFRSLHPFMADSYSFGEEFETKYRRYFLFVANGMFVLFFVVYLYSIVTDRFDPDDSMDIPISLLVGALFGIGLCVSGMCRRSKIYGFFNISEKWDPSLAFVMVGAILVNTFSFQYFMTIKRRPLLADRLMVPRGNDIDTQLIFGAATFGLGWGICGMCPGPAMINSFNMANCIIWIPSLAVGQLLWEQYEKLMAKSSKGKEKTS